MENFEKVEKLVQKSGCSYEDAKKALELTEGDMLEAMIFLEKEGKTAPRGEAWSTRYESQPQYVPVAATAARTWDPANGTEGKGKFKAFCKKAWHLLSTNYLRIKRNGEPLAKLPLWLCLLILFGSMSLVMVLVVVSLFFGFTYSFEGEKQKDMEQVNIMMDKIHRAAESAREEFRK